jgi:hypothetical protein
MTAADREQLQLSLIRWLARGLRFGTPVSFLVACARSEAWPDITPEIVTRQLDYLADPTNALGKPLVVSVVKLNPAESRWKLTAAGQEFAQERGLDE